MPISALAATRLSLSLAEQLGLESDSQITATQARARAAEQGALASGQLQDPRLSMGLFNVPMDNFDLDEQPTTQLRLGLHQQLSRGDTLLLREQRGKLQGDALTARAENRARTTLREVRLAWLEAYYQINAGRIISENRELFERLLDITQDQYAAGRAYQQDVFRAQLELGMLDERILAMNRMEQVSRGRLSYWADTKANLPFPDDLPQLPRLGDTSVIADRIQLHPAIIEQTAIAEASDRNLSIARQRYRPQWTVGAEYRKRFGDDPGGIDRSDMLALVASVDLPMFKKNRQDREVLAATEHATAANLVRTDLLMQLSASLARELGDLEGLSAQLALFSDQLLPDAAANREAALRAYQSGVGGFPALIRAYSAELDLRLKMLRLKVDLGKSTARLLYLDPDSEAQPGQYQSTAGQTGESS